MRKRGFSSGYHTAADDAKIGFTGDIQDSFASTVYGFILFQISYRMYFITCRPTIQGFQGCIHEPGCSIQDDKSYWCLLRKAQRRGNYSRRMSTSHSAENNYY